MAGYYAALAAHYPEVEFAQFNHGADEVQRFFYEAVGGDPDRFPRDLERSLAEIHSAADNFHSYTAPGIGHCALPTSEFEYLSTGGIGLRDWVARLAEGGPVSDVPATPGA
jgi:hypothetical protein